MFGIEKVLVDICGDSDVLKDDIDLIEEGYLDSYAIIELFQTLEDEKVDIFPTQIKKDDLRSLKGIMKIKKTLEIFYLMSFF